MNERIKLIRKELNMNQTEFGERIGVKQTTIAGYESGLRAPLGTVIASICREFHVRREWLESGEGEMYSPEYENEKIIAEALASEGRFIKAVICGISKTPGGWEKAKEIFTAITAELEKYEKPED